MNLYKLLEQESGQSCGPFSPVSLYLAQTKEREHQRRLHVAKAKLYGMSFYKTASFRAFTNLAAWA
jgi:dimethylglycine dehydrogenase